MKKMIAAAALLLSVGIAAPKFVRAEDAPATQPAKKKMAAPKIRFGPYSQLKDLSDEQVDKISELHKKYLADMVEMRAKHYAEVDALLTDAQKEEVKKMEAERKPTTRAAKASAADQKAGNDGEKK